MQGISSDSVANILSLHFALLLFSKCTLLKGFLYRSGPADLTSFTCLWLSNVQGIVTLVHLQETVSHTFGHSSIY